MPVATQQHKPESKGLNHLRSISHPLCASYLLSLFPCLCSLCLGASGGGAWGGDSGGLLTITVADPSTSVRISQPAPSLAPPPGTAATRRPPHPQRHWTSGSSAWAHLVPEGVRARKASESCLGTLILPTLPSDPAPCPPSVSPSSLPSPPSGLARGPAQCPLPRCALFPSPSHHLQHLPQLALDMRAKGPAQDTGLLFRLLPPLLLPALPKPEQGTGTVQGVPRQDSGGCEGRKRESGEGADVRKFYSRGSAVR